MDSVDESFIQNILKAEENEKDIHLVDYNISRKAVGDGNNVSSEVSRLYVNYEKDGKVTKKTYFMKIPSSSPLYSILKHFGIYDKECNMYTTVLPEMYKLIDEREYFSPRCYVSSDLKILILEDLRESGYKMVNRRQQLDFEHAAATLRTLAKFHALSLKVDQMYPQKMDLVKNDGFYASANSDIIIRSYERFLHAVRDIPSLQSVYPQLEQVKNIIWQVIQQRIYPRKNGINVLNHGDFWSNNMLFKYENDQIKVKLVDFQLCRWCNPAVDIMFMMISSVRFEVFESKLDDLLGAYHDSFSYWLRSLKCKETYSLDELKNDFYFCYPYGFNVMASVLPLVMKKAADFNLNKAINKNKEINEDELAKMYKEEKYIAAVTKWLQFYANNGLIV